MRIEDVYEVWAGGSELRSRRRRYKDFTYGRQWNDPVTVDGRTMTEGEYCRELGRRPLTNNLIRQMVKSIVGRFRERLDDGGAGGGLPRVIAERNMIDELDCRLMEEFLISGCAIQRVVSERRPGGDGVWIDNVDPDRFFCNRYSDPRGGDIEVVGMLHDMSLPELTARFGGGDAERVEQLRRIYGNEVSGPRVALGSGESEAFYRATSGRCRAIESWTLETVKALRCRDVATGRVFSVATSEAVALDRLDRELTARGEAPLERRATTGLRWHCRWYAPTGEVLSEYDSPWRHGSHPFVVKHYPMTDGEVHPLVEDVIDTQQYINRLITLIDSVMGSTAKGVLLFPIDKRPEGYSWERIAANWAKPNGIIPIDDVGGGEWPRQIIGSGQPASAYSLLELEMRMLEQISGVSGALSGQAPNGQTSAALYEAQAANGAISLLDTLRTFESLREQRLEKVMRM